MEKTADPRSSEVSSAILAVDCSNLAPSAAVASGAKLLGAAAGTADSGSIETIIPICRQALSCAGITPGSLAKLAAVVGPGSFTGIRTAIGSLEGLAAGWQIPLAGISLTLAAAIEAGLDGRRGAAVVTIRANDREDFTCYYRLEDGAGGRLKVSALTPILSVRRQAAPADASDLPASISADFAVNCTEKNRLDPSWPAAAAARAVAAIEAGAVDCSALTTGGEAIQLQRIGGQAAGALTPAYGKPVNAKTLIERGLTGPA